MNELPSVFDEDWGTQSASCPECGVEHEIVRPGKTQPRCLCHEHQQEITRLRLLIEEKNEALARLYNDFAYIDAKLTAASVGCELVAIDTSRLARSYILEVHDRPDDLRRARAAKETQ